MARRKSIKRRINSPKEVTKQLLGDVSHLLGDIRHALYGFNKRLTAKERKSDWSRGYTLGQIRGLYEGASRAAASLLTLHHPNRATAHRELVRLKRKWKFPEFGKKGLFANEQHPLATPLGIWKPKRGKS